MANIPIEPKKRGGVPWWAWLLGLLVLGVIGYLMTRGDENEVDDVTTVDTTATTGVTNMNGQATAGTITDLSTLYGATDRRGFVGQEVRLTNLVVPTVTGDSTFYVSSPQDPARRVLVVLEGLREGGEGSGTGDDGRYEVNEGDSISLEGRVAEMTAAEAQAWNVSGGDGTAERIYVRARRIANGG